MSDRIQEKAVAHKAAADTRPKAIARHIRISPYKVRNVADAVRGKSIVEALAILSSTSRAGAPEIYKVVASATANAENNQNLSRGDLKVAEIFIDQGPSLKRMQPVSKGRGHSILKRTSHITVILDVVKEAK